MPEITGRLRTPRLATSPTSPAKGEMYYDTVADKLYWWNGTIWVDATGGGGGGGGIAEVNVSTGGPSPRVGELLWVDTDEAPTGIPYIIAPASLPTTGLFDGMEVYYAGNAAQGIVWHLRYNASIVDAYKWQCLGGPKIDARVAGATAHTTNATAFTASVITGGPTLTVPLAGYYEFTATATGRPTSAGLNPDVRIGPYVGGSAVHGGLGAAGGQHYANNAFYTFVTPGERMGPVAANAVMELRSLCQSASYVITIYDMYVAATPARVG